MCALNVCHIDIQVQRQLRAKRKKEPHLLWYCRPPRWWGLEPWKELLAALKVLTVCALAHAQTPALLLEITLPFVAEADSLLGPRLQRP